MRGSMNVNFEKTTALKTIVRNVMQVLRAAADSFDVPSNCMIPRSWLILNGFLLRILQGVGGSPTSNVSIEADCLICVFCRLSPNFAAIYGVADLNKAQPLCP